MILVGLTGGVATGKSTVAGMLRQCGAVVIDADELARHAVKPGRPAWREIVKTFGTIVLNPDRTINRHALGRIVFRSPAKRRALERIIHPRVTREQRRLTRVAAHEDPRSVVVYDVPLLFETGIDRRVDKVLVVTADRETQVARLRKRNGLTRADALRRIGSQMPLAAKVRRADVVLNGTTDKPRLRTAVRSLFRDLQNQA